MESASSLDSQLSKYGGIHWIVLHIPMAGRTPIRTDGSQYDDNPYFDQYDCDDDETKEIYIADEKTIASFVRACHLEDADFEDYKIASSHDMCYAMEDRHYVKEFFERVKLRDEPVRGKILCEMLQSGPMVMATEVTSYFIITHLGNDLTTLLRPRVEECRDNGRCTFTATGKAFCAQRASRCRTCFGDEIGMAICDNCIATCHKGHDTYTIIELKPNQPGHRKSRLQRCTVKKTLMYCDCGYKLKCKVL